MRRHRHLLLWLLLCIAAAWRGQAAEKPADFESFWQQALLQMASIPPLASWQAAEIIFAGPGFLSCRAHIYLKPEASLPPIVYLLDRDGARSFRPHETHSWLVLDVRAFVEQGEAGPEPTRHPLYGAVQAASRALQLLLAQTRPTHSQAGLVGEGWGGAVAIMLAALAPQEVAFVAAHEPYAGPQYDDIGLSSSVALELQQAERRFAAFRARLPQQLAYFDLRHFAPQICSPVLLSFGGNDRLARLETILALYERLAAPKQLIEFRRAGHCQPEDLAEWDKVWRNWASALVNEAGESP